METSYFYTHLKTRRFNGAAGFTPLKEESYRLPHKRSYSSFNGAAGFTPLKAEWGPLQVLLKGGFNGAAGFTPLKGARM